VTGAPPALDLARVAAGAGETVAVQATLSSRGEDLSAVAMDITFDTSLVEVAVGAGRPDCVLDDAIVMARLRTSNSCRVARSRWRRGAVLRVGVIAPDNNQALTDGTTFTCRFHVAESAGDLSILLDNVADASSPEGNQVGMAGEDGAITVN